MIGCNHKAVLEILQSGSKDYWECLVAHFKPDGSKAPGCIQCPSCGKYIGWAEQEELLKLVYCFGQLVLTRGME